MTDDHSQRRERRLLVRGLRGRVWGNLPEGRPLPEPVWQRRHRLMLGLLWLHVLVLPAVAMLDHGLVHSLGEGAPLATLGLLAAWPRRGRRFRATVASIGLVTASAVVVHLSNGNIEMHFHFFVMLAFITLYQDWMPFLFAIGLVTLHHGVGGVLEPTAVYNHPDAWAHPWKWAVIHAAFVLAASVASVVSWRLNEAARALTDSVLDAAGEGIYVLDGDGQTVFVNPAARAMLGWTDAVTKRPELDLLSLNVTDDVEPDDALGPAGHVLREGSLRHVGTTRFRRRDGSDFPVEFVATPLCERGRVTGAVVTFDDVSDRVTAEEALRTSEARFRLLFANNPHPVWVYDLDTLAFLEVNDAAVSQYGYSREQFLTMRLIDIRPADEPPLRIELGSSRSRSGSTGRWRHQRKSGEIFPVALTSHKLDFVGRRAALMVAEDVSERARFEEQLEHQALHDSLTALPNRALFIDRLQHALSRRQRSESGLAVLFVDLDGFKVVNDGLGHTGGDELLVAIASRLATAIRPGDTLARFGGDEFLVLLEGLEAAADPIETAQRLLAALRQPVRVAGRDVFVTASIGVSARMPSDAPASAEDLVREADIAMYQAKAAGKSRVVAFEAGMHPGAVERLQLETDLRWAISRDELVLHYQPEVDLSTGTLTGVEALVRWRHPERGLVSPGDFIPVAEETGLIIPIGSWVLRAACLQAQAWQALRPDDEPLVMGVNLSARQLAQPNLVDEVATVLRETGFAPESLRLEITETAAMRDPEVTITLLRGLRELGVQLAIDDFGTGYSSLSYLRSLPAQTLKIDRSFVVALSEDTSAAAIVRAITSVAHTLGMDVTAEGVETAAQLAQVAALQCDRVQGYYFSRPLPAEDLVQLLRAEQPHEVTSLAA